MPKGDADNLRADLDDGFARVSNLLLEALCCAPLSGAEARLVAFVMRRTYGWARGQSRDLDKMDTITAAEIMKGTGLPRGTVGNCLSSLCRANVLLTELAATDNRRRYGVNPDVNAWGMASRDWVMYRTDLRDARDTSTYNRVDLLPNTGIAIPENGKTSSRIQENQGAVSPCVQSSEGTPTESLQRTSTENGNTPPIVPPANAVVTSPPTGSVRDSSSDTPVQAAIRAVWDAYHLDGPPTPPLNEKGKPMAPSYATLTKLVQTHGIPAFTDYAEFVTSTGETLPEGAVAWPWFCARVTDAMKARWKWDPTSDHALPKNRRPRNERHLSCCDDGTPIWQSDWTIGQEAFVAEEVKRNNWSEEYGATLTPVKGFCCVDGRAYTHENWPEGVKVNVYKARRAS